MERIFLFPNTQKRDPAVDAWLEAHGGEVGRLARHWFSSLRNLHQDVRETLHDGHPTACVGPGAFAYVDAFKGHACVGFFHGSELKDPARLLEGTGKFMRHVKLRPGVEVDAQALAALLVTAHQDMQGRVAMHALTHGNQG